MQPKERLLATLRGQAVDRPAWSPFLAYWWEAQPAEVTRAGQLAFLQSIGADPLLRGFTKAWNILYDGVEIRDQASEDRRVEVWATPVGELALGYRHSRDGNTWFLVDHPIREVEDLKILQWIYEHARIEYRPEIEQELAATGDQGLHLPLIGAELKTCFQSLVEKWSGTEALTYLLADAPEAVEDCLSAMRRVSDRTAECCAQCGAEAFIFWEDSSTTNISPGMFEAYTMPEIAAWGQTLHRAGKLLVHHACGHLRHLLPLMARLPIDAVESISPPPTGNIDIPEAFSLLPEHIALIGGIEPVFFQDCTQEALDRRVEDLLSATRGRRYLLANSDSCPPGVALWKMRRVSQRVQEYQGF